MPPAGLTAALVCTLAISLAACGSGETIAHVATSAARRGKPCEASEVEPANAGFARECAAQQHAQAERAAIREGERLKAEASRPARKTSTNP
jgi:hypothetical protein